MDGFKKDLVALITIMVAVSVSAGGLWYLLFSSPPVNARRVAMGDKVSMDYIGWFEDGTVFDTSLPGVAKDNATYPKALSFTYRGASSYKPFEFTVGEGVIAGWSKGVVGMMPHETRRLVIPPEDGYGFPDTSKILTLPLVESVPVIEEISVQGFRDNYSNIPSVGLVVKDTTYGWEKSVIYVEGDIVLMRNEAKVGDMLDTSWPWDVRVISMDSSANSGFGEIKLRHLITPDDVNRVKGEYKGETFYLTGVDPEDGTFTIDKNDFVVGKTLIFQVTLLKFVD